MQPGKRVLLARRTPVIIIASLIFMAAHLWVPQSARAQFKLSPAMIDLLYIVEQAYGKPNGKSLDNLIEQYPKSLACFIGLAMQPQLHYAAKNKVYKDQYFNLLNENFDFLNNLTQYHQANPSLSKEGPTDLNSMLDMHQKGSSKELNDRVMGNLSLDPFQHNIPIILAKVGGGPSSNSSRDGSGNYSSGNSGNTWDSGNSGNQPLAKPVFGGGRDDCSKLKGIEGEWASRNGVFVVRFNVSGSGKHLNNQTKKPIQGRWIRLSKKGQSVWIGQQYDHTGRDNRVVASVKGNQLRLNYQTRYYERWFDKNTGQMMRRPTNKWDDGHSIRMARTCGEVEVEKGNAIELFDLESAPAKSVEIPTR